MKRRQCKLTVHRCLCTGCRYKESLGLSAISGKLNVVIHEMRITPDDGHDPIVVPLETDEQKAAANELKLTVKEGVGFVVR